MAWRLEPAAAEEIMMEWARELAAEGDAAFQQLAPQAFFLIQKVRAMR